MRIEELAEKISDAELAVVRAVWRQGGTATFAQIRSMTADAGWESPSTLNTLLGRLVKKGVLHQQKRDVYYYSAAISEREFEQQKARSFVDKVFGGSVKGLLAALAEGEGVSRSELDELREFWEKGRDDHE